MNRDVRAVFGAVAAVVCSLALVRGHLVAAGDGPPASTDRTGDWPTLHNDEQRSGYTADPVFAKCERKWYRSFVEEMIGAAGRGDRG